MRDNFVDLPTDCPQRDERLGWTGDIQVFAPDGRVPLRLHRRAAELAARPRRRAAPRRHPCPNFHPWIDCGFPNDPAAAWGDAAVIVPWTLYRRTGDLGILERPVRQHARLGRPGRSPSPARPGLWSTGFQLGDWLDPAAPPDRPGDSRTDAHLVATAYHARTAGSWPTPPRCSADAPTTSGTPAIAERAAAAFRDAVRVAIGRVVSDTATALALAIVLRPARRRRAASRAGQPAGRAGREGDYLIQHRLRRHADHLRRARRAGAHRRRVPPAAAGRAARRGSTP